MEGQLHYDVALHHFRAGRVPEALTACKEALSENEDHPGALHLTGILVFQAGDAETAEALITRAIEVKPDFAEALNNLAIIVKKRGAIDQAVELYKVSLEIDPTDAQVAFNLGVALKQLGRMVEAEEALATAIRLRPNHAEGLFAHGQVLRALGRTTEAIAAYRAATERKTAYGPALAALGGLLRESGDAEAAVAALKQARVVQPFSADLTTALGLALHDAGRLDDAEAIFQEGLAVEATAGLLTGLGTVRRDQSRLDEAIVCFERALARDPGSVEARLGLGAASFAKGDIDGAIGHYLKASMLDPRRAETHMRLYAAAQVAEDLPLALEHLSRALGLKRLYSEPCVTGAPRQSVLVLCAPGSWQINVPTDFLFDTRHYAIHRYYLTESPGDAEIDALPTADVVFNAVAEADRAAETLAHVERVAARLGRPLINRPEAVRRTTRDAVASLLAGIEHCVAPPVRRVARDALADVDVSAPFLIRPIGSHAGDDLAKIDGAADLEAYLPTTNADAFYLTPFADYRLADGHFRKYRIVFVDGVAYPYHLAIDKGWKIHYYSSEMRDGAWMRDEEEAFLTDLSSVFHGPLAKALDAIVAAIGLDYFGMDCSVMPDGRLLVFEVNAAMIVHLKDNAELYPYKHREVPKIFRAVEALLAARAIG